MLHATKSLVLIALIALLTSGTVLANPGNVVGVFFDPQATTTCTEGAPEVPLTAYICLLNPAASNVIDGWELRVDVTGDASVLGWQPAHSGLNVFAPPEFQVAIPPSDVLPAAPVVVLATFTVTPHSTSPITIFLGPTARSTLAGSMCFIRDHDVGGPLVMRTLTGNDALPCAFISESVWPCARVNLPASHEVLTKLVPGSVTFSSPLGGGLLADVSFQSACLDSLSAAYGVVEISKFTLAAPDSVAYTVRGTGAPRVSTQLRDLYRFVLADSARTTAFAGALTGCAAVRFASAPAPGEYASLPNDPLVNPYLRNTAHPSLTLDVSRLWLATGPEEGTCQVGTALLDEGAWVRHEDLAGRVTQHDGDGVSGHATALAGILAARGNNARGITGLTNCALHDYMNGGLTDANVARGLQAACALTGPEPVAVAVLGATFAGERRDHLLLQNACDEFYNANRLLVVAAGNHGTAQARYPAIYPSATGVGGITPSGIRWALPPRDAAGSALGPNLDFVALADSIWVTDGAGAPAPYRFVGTADGGTSYAAAQFAGAAAALLKLRHGNLYVDDVVNILALSAQTDLPPYDAVCRSEGFAYCYGQGLPRVAEAYLLMSRNRLEHGSFTGGASSVAATPLGLIQVGNVPWDQLTGGAYQVTEYRHERDVEFAAPYVTTPHVWGVGCLTTGGVGANTQDWTAFSAKLDCRVVGASPTGCRLATSVYKFEAGGPGGETHWWPSDGSSLTWGYSALGAPEDGLVGVGAGPAGPRLTLAAAPTPFNARVRFAIGAADAGRAKLAVYDLRGRLVRDFGDLNLVSGANQLEWDGRDTAGRTCATGAYLVQCRLGADRAIVKVMLVK